MASHRLQPLHLTVFTTPNISNQTNSGQGVSEHAKRGALIRLLRGPRQQTDDPGFFKYVVNFALQSPELDLATLDSISLVFKSWRNLVYFEFLRGDAATHFWQRVFAGENFVLRPELADADKALLWLQSPMAIGSRDMWMRGSWG